MKAQELKNILDLPFSIDKGFAPITEYIYINNNKVKATNMEFYLEITLNEDLPFNGCVLAEPLKKFLNTVNKDTELKFETNENVLTILYGKKNKFNIPMESLDNFPESPATKYTETNFVSDTDITFNGVYF